jgi:short-subunit dehydrogenase
MSGFKDRYGNWALVAGASEGVGLAFAHAMAEIGVNVVLLSRRQIVLEKVAGQLQEEHGIETRVLAIDLFEKTAAASIIERTADLEIGLLIYCAGGDPNFRPFLESPISDGESLLVRNCLIPMQLCHHFARPMVERGRGGIILVSSGAGLVGVRRMVAYGASKAFEIILGEALWAELNEQGVDVLSLVLGVTDTPALRRTLAKRGMLADPDDGTPIPGASTPKEVVIEALDNLSDGPTWIVGEHVREGTRALGAMNRNDAVWAMVEAGAGVLDQKLS